MTPRLWIWGEVVTEWPSTERVKSWEEGRSDLGPMTMIYDLLQFSLRKFAFIQDFIAGILLSPTKLRPNLGS